MISPDGMIERCVLLYLIFVASIVECIWGFATNVNGLAIHDARKDSIAVIIDDPPLFEQEGKAIASDLGLPAISVENFNNSDEYRRALRLMPFEMSGSDPTYALCLETKDDPSVSDAKNPNKGRKIRQKAIKRKPFFIDLCPSENSRIGARGAKEGGGDLLIKAVAPGKSQADGRKGAVVFDLTAGLGQDSLILAMNGASQVHMVERDPIVVSLLQDALRRTNLLSGLQGIDERAERAQELSTKLFLHYGDSKDIINQLEIPDIVYLDPMFPPRTKSAKVKKGMALLHSLLDTQSTDRLNEEERLEEEVALLAESIKVAKSKVVVKRPSKALPLGGDLSSFRASYAIEGSTNRWDVYVTSLPT